MSAIEILLAISELRNRMKAFVVQSMKDAIAKTKLMYVLDHYSVRQMKDRPQLQLVLLQGKGRFLTAYGQKV